MEQAWTFRARGRMAHWGGIHFGPERMTQRAPSRSAIVGLLRSTFGKYEYRWEPLDVTFLTAPSTMPVQSNEVQSFDGSCALVSTQRTRTFLYGIDLVFRATISVAPCAGRDDNMAKAVEMINKRVRQGYRRYQPYFGIRECPAHMSWVEDPSTLPQPDASALGLFENLGNVFYDIDMDDPERPAYLAPLSLVRGVVTYPRFDEVRNKGIRYHLPRVPS
jgi:CRISPR-associated Cas5-like protein